MVLRRTVILFFLVTVFLGSMCGGQALPSTFFGMHINQSKTAWPSVAFGSYRMWDDGTSWALVNPANGVYNWAPIDSWVAKAEQQNVQLLYTFGRTPVWASSNPTLSCNYAPGECAPPSDFTYWDNFVTALVTRYKGKIKYYEIWNEPNQPPFWKGTTAQLVEMTSRAAGIIHTIDPEAQVGSPAATWTNTTAWSWLDGFLTAGGGTYLDVIDFHGYTGNNNAESIFTIIDNVQKVRDAHGLSLPMLITEGAWGVNSTIPNEDAQAAFLVQRYLLITSRPAIKAYYWYQWDNTVWGTLWDSTNGIHPAGVAYGTMTKLLIGATANGCNKDSSATWNCSFTLANGNAAVAVWNATNSGSYTPGSEYAVELGIDGSSQSVNGSDSFVIGNAPVFFTAPSQPAPSVALSVTPSGGITPVAVSATASVSVPSGVAVKSTTISFGDGTSVQGSTGSHTYTRAGSYAVVVTVVDDLNRTATATQNMTVTAPQSTKATVSVSPSTGKAPLQVTASSAGSTAASSIASSVIDFGDGTVVSGTSAAHTYMTAGNYTVTAKVTDSLGASSTASVTVNALANQPPVAKLAITQSGATVTASTAGSYDLDGTIASTVISWGDGNSTQGASGSHTYAARGTYTVVATVTDNSGAHASASQGATVTMNAPPVAVMLLTPTAAVGYKVLTSGSYAPSGTIVSTIIDWGDGRTTAATAGGHTYYKAGTYQITVTVTDNHGLKASTSATAKAWFGIYMVSPKTGSTTGSQVHVVGYAAAPDPIVSTRILIDGNTVFSGTSWDINTYLRVASGSHNVVVLAFDQHQTRYQSSFSITVN
jgi:PKD repeat protein